MIIAVDFDSVATRIGPDLLCIAGARESLAALKKAGHVLLLWSPRTNRARQHLAEFDPLVRAGVTGDAQDDASRASWAAADREMRAFVDEYLAGYFDAIDDGRQGCPCVDLWVMARSVSVTDRAGWAALSGLYGEP